MSKERRIPWIAGALLGLLVLSALGAQLHLSAWNLALSLGIAGAKAALVAWFFMGLDSAPPLQRLVAAVGVAALAVLMSLGTVDFGSRRDEAAPWQMPQRVPARVQGSLPVDHRDSVACKPGPAC